MANVEKGLALDSQTVQAFQEQITVVKAHQVYGLPDFQQTINHAGKYTRPSLRLGAGLFLGQTLLQADEQAVAVRPDAFTFKAQPGHRLGREKSHNEVFFGKLTTAWTREMSMRRKEAHLAVKPTKNREAMLGELAMFQYLIDLNIPTFKPSGILTTPSSGNYLMTHFEKPVATMDTVEWSELEPNEMWEQVDFAVKTMALLHGRMLFHGDLEFKNVGFDERGDLIVVDPELMVSARDMAEIARDGTDEQEVLSAQIRIKQSMSNDFTSVCRSIEEFIIPSLPIHERPKNSASLFKQYARHLFRPYEQAIQDSDSEFKAQLLTAFEKVFQEHKQRSR